MCFINTTDSGAPGTHSALGPLRLNALLVLEDGPVKYIVVLESLPDEEIPEELSQVSARRK